MKKRLMLCMMLLLCACTSQNATPLFEGKEDLKIVVASDLHYYAKELFEECSWFEEALLNGDGQMPHNTHLIAEKFVSEVIEENPDLVILTGDLTYNGEKLSHQQLAQTLQKLEDHGIEVAIINGNHDINNGKAYKYNEEGASEVESVTVKEFKNIYKNFGYSQAASLDKDSLSYRLALNDTYDLIMIDSCYTEACITSSKLSDETMAWIEDQLIRVQEANKKAIVGLHHNVAIHCDAIYNGYVLTNHNEVENLLQQYDVPLVLSGHIHTQHTENMEGMYEIVSGALSAAPVQYGILSIDAQSVDYHTQEVLSVEGDEDFFKTASYNRFLAQMTGYFDEETSKLLATYIAEVNLDYFSGSVNENIEAYKNDVAYSILKENAEDASFLINYLNVMLSETTAHQELQFTID